MAKVSLGRDGEFELVHQFNEKRGIVDMGGVYALVDRVSENEWELSGLPAREDEKPVMRRFEQSVKNQTTVTAPDGTTKTYGNDE